MTDPRHVTELLPGVANGSADAAERARVDAHLASCPACAAQLEDWRRIALAVREDAVPAPGTAAVLDGVWRRLDTGEAAEGAAPPRGRSSWSRAWQPVWSTAAVLLLVLALMVVERGQQTPQEVLLAAAVRTTEQETAALQVNGTARFAMQAPDSSAAFPADAAAVALDGSLDGQGAVHFGEALHVRLRLDLDAGALGVEGRSEIIERLVVRGQRYERRSDDEWIPLDDTTGIVGLALLHPRLPELVLTKTEGRIDVENEVERLHGVDVRRYAFDLTPDALPQPTGAAVRYRTEVWLGEADGLLHALRLRATGPTSTPVAGSWDIDLRVELVDIGGPITIPSPPAIPGGGR